jgi:hypothetical protein
VDDQTEQRDAGEPVPDQGVVLTTPSEHPHEECGRGREVDEDVVAIEELHRARDVEHPPLHVLFGEHARGALPADESIGVVSRHCGRVAGDETTGAIDEEHACGQHQFDCGRDRQRPRAAGRGSQPNGWTVEREHHGDRDGIDRSRSSRWGVVPNHPRGGLIESEIVRMVDMRRP